MCVWRGWGGEGGTHLHPGGVEGGDVVLFWVGGKEGGKRVCACACYVYHQPSGAGHTEEYLAHAAVLALARVTALRAVDGVVRCGAGPVVVFWGRGGKGSIYMAFEGGGWP